MISSKESTKNTSIIDGSITKALLSFFFPILLGTFFQQLYNTIDAIIVGHYVGKEALAAVGGGASIFINLLVGFFVGLSSGASVLVSQFYGSKNDSEVSQTVHTSFALSIFGGITVMILGILFARPMLILTKTTPDTIEPAIQYLIIYFTGMVPMFIYNMSSGILRAIGDSKTPLLVLIICCFCNIILDIVFVLILKMQVAGAAWATVISQIISAIVSIIILKKAQDSYRLEIKKIRFSPHILKSILRIGFPAGLQSILYTVSNLIIQTNINTFGTDDIAAWAAYGKIDAIFWMTISAFGISVTTFAGLNYGAKKYDRIKKSMWKTLGLSSIASVAFSIILCFTGKWIFMLFTKDAAVIDEGMKMLLFLAPFFITFVSIESISGTARGCGSSFVPMLICAIGICGSRILWLYTVGLLNHSIYIVMTCYPLSWILTSIAFWIYWFSGKWIKK